MVTHDRFAGDEDRRGEGRVGQQAIQPILQDAQDSAIGLDIALTETTVKPLLILFILFSTLLVDCKMYRVLIILTVSLSMMRLCGMTNKTASKFVLRFGRLMIHYDRVAGLTCRWFDVSVFDAAGLKSRSSPGQRRLVFFLVTKNILKSSNISCN